MNVQSFMSYSKNNAGRSANGGDLVYEISKGSNTLSGSFIYYFVLRSCGSGSDSTGTEESVVTKKRAELLE